MLAIRGATVVDVDRHERADVLVEDDRVVDVVAPGAGDPDRELSVEGYLAPGLVDGHVHLSMDGRPDPTTGHAESDAMVTYRAADALRETVRAGVTTVRDLGARGPLAVAADRAVREGVLSGPRVVAAGQAITLTGGHGHRFGREADGPAEVRKAAREQLKAGARALKCMATGGVLTEGELADEPQLTRAEVSALTDVGHARELPAAAHAHGDEGIRRVVDAGIDSVEHGTFMRRETADRLAEEDVVWVPTASALHGIVEHPDAGIPEWALAKAEGARDALDRAFDHARAAGVTVAMGTDAGTPFNHHGDNARELELLVDHGLAPERAFAAGTAVAADLLGVDAGRVEPGSRADLVVLDEDPSERPATYRDPDLVVAAGEVVAGERKRNR